MKNVVNGRKNSIRETEHNLGVDEISEEALIQRLLAELRPDLEEMTPSEGINRFLNHKRSDVAASTLDGYEQSLTRFETFLQRQDVDDLSDLNGRIIDDYTQWLQYESSDQVDELASGTMRDELYLLRDCIAYFERINAVRPELSDAIEIPDVDDSGRDVDVDSDRVAQILDYLARFEYASLQHIVWLLAARIARRTGACIALDVGDAYLDRNEPYLEFQHRPPETPLKNGEDSEGHVALTEDEADIIADYINETRPDVTSCEGRKPLLATSQGRLARSSFRRYIYRWSRPCAIGDACPHNRDPDTCEAAASLDNASRCPSSRSPHALRHGYISEGLRRGIPIEVLSDRVDATPEVIREYYDESRQEERLEVRREILGEYSSDNGGGYL